MTPPYKSAIDYLINKEGVAKEAVDNLKKKGFRHTTMICPDIFEQIAYEKSLKKQYDPKDIEIIPLSGGGKAYCVRDKIPPTHDK